MIWDHERESRLPKWAQQYLNQLRLENQVMKERLDQLTNTDISQTNVRENDPIHGERALPKDAVIEFRDSRPNEFDAIFTVFNIEGGLRVDCTKGLVVKPSFSNSVAVLRADV